MDALKRYAGTGILLLIGWGVDVIPGNDSWLPSIIIWSLAFIWAALIGISWLSEKKQPRFSRSEGVRLGDTVDADVKKGGYEIPTWEFYTRNAKNRKVGDKNQPIQSIRFIEPIDKIVKVGELPRTISLESSRWKRLMYWLLRTAEPQIIVKEFSKDGLLFDENFTWNKKILIELYNDEPTLQNVKTPIVK